MVRQLGLPEKFVNDTTDEWLETTCEELAALASTFPAHMAALKAAAAEKYLALLRPTLGVAGIGVAS